MATQNLRTPGPTPLPPTVREALARQMIAHRGSEFADVMHECVAGLQWAFQTRHDMLVLTTSGTGGLESLVVNTLSPGQRLLVASMGYFGERMAKIARAFGIDVLQIDFEPGQAVDPQLLAERLAAEPDIDTVFVTHNETSTGVLNPLADLARAVRNVRPEALLLVDGISSIGSAPVQPEDWGCDVVVAGSQKGWMIPPGLSFVAVSPRAWERQAHAQLPKFYFDWQQARRAAADGSTPWTPALSLFFGLQAALRLMRAEGLEPLFERHRHLAEYTREGLRDLDLRLLADPRFASPTVTTAYVPDGVDAQALLRELEARHQVVLAGGQGRLEGQIIRVGHMGWVDQDDLAAVLRALQVELTALAWPIRDKNSLSELPLVLVADPIAEEGLGLLRQHTRVHVVSGDREALARELPDAEALLVRSETRVTAALLESAPRLRVIGRAGAGVDTIDVDAATARGIVVVNAPGGNAVAAAEHSLALMFALARRVSAADASLKRGQWSRSAYMGSELTGKTLGLIGLGRVGSEVARRAIGLDMHVLVYDPYVPDEHARRIGLEPADLDALLEAADFVSLHVPLTEATRGILSVDRIAHMRPGAFVVNCARGGLIDEAALLAALDEGRLAGAGVDVFSSEPVASDDPLPRHPKVVATPHLGASTVEAQANVAAQVASEVLAVLDGRPAQFAVNAPSLRSEDAEALQPYMGLVTMLGRLATQLADDRVRSAEISFRGEVAARNVGVLTAAAVRGLLEPVSDVPVNLVNARLLAQQRGLDVVETRSTTPEQYTSLVRVTVNTRAGATSVAGVISDGRAHVVQIDDYELHLPPTPGYLLVTQHVDRPGIIGLVGTLLGEADINISSMQVGRRAQRGEALMLLSVDEPIPAEVMERIRTAASLATVKLIKL